MYKSDHAPIMLTTHSNQMEHIDKKLFRFESLWLSNEDCGRAVETAWNECLGSDIDFRIENCASNLASWADSTFGMLRRKI